jgi:hypothetical protein
MSFIRHSCNSELRAGGPILRLTFDVDEHLLRKRRPYASTPGHFQKLRVLTLSTPTQK